MTPPPKKRPARIQIQDVWPSLDCGRWPAKRTLGGTLEVSATIFADGHDVLGAAVRHRAPCARKWAETTMEHLGNDRWLGSVEVDELGRWRYSIVAWVDRFASWRHELERKVEADQGELSSELAEVAGLLGGKSSHRGSAGARPPREAETELDARSADRGRERARVGAPGTSSSPLLRRLRRRRKGRAAARRARLRRPLLPADPSVGTTHRKGRTTRSRRRKRPGQPLGDREAGRASTGGRAGARTLADLAARRPPPAHGSARPRPASRPHRTTRGSSSTPSGSSAGPTAPSSTPRTRPSATRTSTT
jgi:hypothetical protein